MRSRILVADDDPTALAAIAYTLEQEDFDLDTVADGEAALAAARRMDYDLLILSRIRAILRRQERERRRAPLVRRVDNLEIDFEGSTVSRSGRRIALTRSGFRLLALLAERPGEVVSRRKMMERLWQSAFVGDERAGDIHVSNLRRKLGPETIETVRGEGLPSRREFVSEPTHSDPQAR